MSRTRPRPARSWPIRRSSVLSYLPCSGVASTNAIERIFAGTPSRFSQIDDPVAPRDRTASRARSRRAPRRRRRSPPRAKRRRAPREVPDDEPEERGVAPARAERAVEPRARRARRADARVDRARVVVGARIRLDARRAATSPRCRGRRSRCGRRSCRPARCARPARASPSRARAVLRLRREDEARVARVLGVQHVVVVVDPAASRGPSLSMNGLVSFSKPPPDASDANATSSTTTRPFSWSGLRELARRGERELGPACVSKRWLAFAVARDRRGPSATDRTRPGGARGCGGV